MQEVAKLNPSMGQAMESVLIEGDLQKLSSEQRVMYYKKICESLSLNYLTKPFAYIRLNGKLTLYALKDCTEQLRKRDDVSITSMKNELINDVFIVTANGVTKDGKQDVATGAVCITGLKGENLANAYMKAETKAKRRLTLSLCGLGMPDESEIDSIPKAQKVEVTETGEIVELATVTVVPALERKFKSDEEILEGISQEQLNILAEEISNAADMDSLKSAYARAYVLHGLREDLMPRLKELKDMRKKQLETADVSMKRAFGDDECPNLGGAA